MPYDATYHTTLSANAEKSAPIVVAEILKLVPAQSVIDVGCGEGGWLAAFLAAGVPRILGLEKHADPAKLLIPRDNFLVTDLTKPVLSMDSFDLVVSLETAEHLPPDAADTFIDSLTRLGNVVAFSAAIPHQGGMEHLNEQWPEYWAALFAERGFAPIDAIRPVIWKNPNVEWWYAQNLILYANADGLARWPLLRAARSRCDDRPLNLVHPRNWTQGAARALAPSKLFQATLGATKRRWLGAKPH